MKSDAVKEPFKYWLVVEKYQCPGCTIGEIKTCGSYKRATFGYGCANHSPGTFISGIGKIFLGLPKGFNRTACKMGEDNGFRPTIFLSVKDFNKGGYDEFNVPVWKYLTSDGLIIVKGYHPRLNQGFLHIIVNKKEFKKIGCLEITDAMIKGMD